MFNRRIALASVVCFRNLYIAFSYLQHNMICLDLKEKGMLDK
jgi:hypothetical protein